MKKKIAMLVLTMGIGLGLANRATTIAFARPQDDKMKDDNMAGHHKTGKKDKMHKKEKKSHHKMKGDQMKEQDKMDHPQM